MELRKPLIFSFFLINFFNVLDVITTSFFIEKETNIFIIFMFDNFGFIITSILKLLFVFIISYCILKASFISKIKHYKEFVFLCFTFINLTFIYVLIGNLGVLFGIT